jgi:iron complex outermembrane receptor protein
MPERVRILDGISCQLPILTNKASICVNLFSAAVNRFKFKDFLLMVQMIIQETTAAPDAQWNVGVDLSTTSGFKLHTFSKVGAMPLNDQNSKYTQAYSL